MSGRVQARLEELGVVLPKAPAPAANYVPWVITGNQRLSILSLLVLFACGGIILSFVNEQEGRRAAEALQDTGRRTQAHVPE